MTAEADQFFASRAPTNVRENGRYKLPDPITGAERSWQTASNFAYPLTDQWRLNRWRMRQLLRGVAARPDLIALLAATVDPDNAKLDEVITTALEVAGTTADANMGTAVHEALRAADEGKPYPPMFEQHVTAYRAALARYRLTVHMVERLVCSPDLGAAGRFDRVFLEADGTPVTGDVKTSGRLDLGEHEHAVQFAIYQGGTHVRDEANNRWLPMSGPNGRPVRDDYAIVVHVDRESGAVAVYRADLIIGRHGANLAEQVRGWRKSGPVMLPYVPPVLADDSQGPFSAEIPGAVTDPFDTGPAVSSAPAALQTMSSTTPTLSLPGPGGTNGTRKTAAELQKMQKAQVQEYCRSQGMTSDLAHTKGILITMLGQRGLLAVPGAVTATSPMSQIMAGPPPPTEDPNDPRTMAFRTMALARINTAGSVGEMETIRKSIVKAGGDQAWTDEMTEVARARVAVLDSAKATSEALDSLALVAACDAPEQLAKLWEKVTVGGSLPGNWTPEIDQAARARLDEINNSKPAAPANPFTG